MKHLILHSIIGFLLLTPAWSNDDLLSKIDVSHPYYGNQTYGSPQTNHLKSVDGSGLIIYQARYGGDGEHTENIIKIFKIKNSIPKKMYDANLSDVEFVLESDILKSIKGNHIETLCDVCDGWEVASPNDVFKIPLEININDFKTIVAMTDAEKEALLASLALQVEANIEEQLSYGNNSYSTYAYAVMKKITELLK